MTHRTIDLPEQIYKELMALKQEDETLSEVISRLIKKGKTSKSIKKFAGIFQNSSEEWESLEKTLYEDRLRSGNERNINFESRAITFIFYNYSKE